MRILFFTIFLLSGCVSVYDDQYYNNKKPHVQDYYVAKYKCMDRHPLKDLSIVSDNTRLYEACMNSYGFFNTIK